MYEDEFDEYANNFDLNKEPKMNKPRLGFYVAGVQYHEIHKCLKEMEVGDSLQMTPEPTNKYDPNAVRIEFEDVMIGYVSAKISAEVTALIESVDEVTCQIIELNKDEKPWKQVKVVIEEVS